MMGLLISAALLLAGTANWVLAQEQQQVKCGEGALCPEEFPCCSRK